MLKKIIILLVLVLAFTSYCTSEAFFLKKKSVNKQADVNQQESKVLVVQIYADWCPSCKNIQPTLDLLKKEISDINFVKLDVSTLSKASESQKTAKNLSIEDFYKLNKSKTSTVAIFVPTTKELISTFQNNNDIDEYKAAVMNAKTREKGARTGL